MIWKCHRAVTAVSIYAITTNIPMAVIAMVGSVFPDAIEYIMPGDWQSHHRKSSHWFPIYLSIIVFIYLFLKTKNSLLFPSNDLFSFIQNSITNNDYTFIIMNILFWFFVGALFHIIEDSVCGSIPILSPNDRTSFIRLFKVGTFSEYFYVFLFCISVLYYKFLY